MANAWRVPGGSNAEAYPVPPPITLPEASRTTEERFALRRSSVGWSFDHDLEVIDRSRAGEAERASVGVDLARADDPDRPEAVPIRLAAHGDPLPAWIGIERVTVEA